MQLRTVAIANDDGSDYIVINESDFDRDRHIVWAHLPPNWSPELEPEPGATADGDLTDAIAERTQALIDAHTVAELEDRARDLEMSGYSTLNKAELAAAIAETEAAAAN